MRFELALAVGECCLQRVLVYPVLTANFANDGVQCLDHAAKDFRPQSGNLPEQCLHATDQLIYTYDWHCLHRE